MKVKQAKALFNKLSGLGHSARQTAVKALSIEDRAALSDLGIKNFTQAELSKDMSQENVVKAAVILDKCLKR